MSAELPSEGAMATVAIGRAPLSWARLTFCEVAHPVVTTRSATDAARRIRRMSFLFVRPATSSTLLEGPTMESVAQFTIAPKRRIRAHAWPTAVVDARARAVRATQSHHPARARSWHARGEARVIEVVNGREAASRSA